MSEPIDNLWCRFRNRQTETDYQQSVHSRYLKNNLIGTLTILAIHLCFTFVDFLDSAVPLITVQIRLASVFLSLAILALLFSPRIRAHHGLVISTVMMTLATAWVLMTIAQPSLENNYYIGLIQGYIVASLLLRLEFINTATILILLQAGFSAAAFSKGEPQLASLQVANTMVVSLTCVVGVYLLQRYQRSDYMKNRLIEKQNRQLQRHLEQEQDENARRVAALNLLTHFVRTPLHQIHGFSDILASNLDAADGDNAKNARHIKDASASLSQGVAAILEYHRVDEASAALVEEPVDILDLLEGLENYAGETRVSFESKLSATALVDPAVMQSAAKAMGEYFKDPRSDISEVVISATFEGDSPIVTITDNGRVMSETEFASETEPLTDFKGYLNQPGERLPMALRTAARAFAINKCEFLHVATEGGNHFIVRFPAKTVMRKAQAA